MADNRKNARYRTLALARIDKRGGGEYLLRDLSITGCRIECPGYTEIDIYEQYSLEVLPEDAAKVGSFTLKVESKWIKTGGDSIEVGFRIMESPKGRNFLRYVDYLSWRYSQGNSMTDDHNPEFPADVQ